MTTDLKDQFRELGIDPDHLTEQECIEVLLQYYNAAKIQIAMDNRDVFRQEFYRLIKEKTN